MLVTVIKRTVIILWCALVIIAFLFISADLKKHIWSLLPVEVKLTFYELYWAEHILLSETLHRFLWGYSMSWDQQREPFHFLLSVLQKMRLQLVLAVSYFLASRKMWFIILVSWASSQQDRQWNHFCLWLRSRGEGMLTVIKSFDQLSLHE